MEKSLDMIAPSFYVVCLWITMRELRLSKLSTKSHLQKKTLALRPLATVVTEKTRFGATDAIFTIGVFMELLKDTAVLRPDIVLIRRDTI